MYYIYIYIYIKHVKWRGNILSMGDKGWPMRIMIWWLDKRKRRERHEKKCEREVARVMKQDNLTP